MEDCSSFVQILEEDGIFIGCFLYPVDVRHIVTVGGCIPCNEGGIANSILHSNVLFDAYWNTVLGILTRLKFTGKQEPTKGPTRFPVLRKYSSNSFARAMASSAMNSVAKLTYFISRSI